MTRVDDVSAWLEDFAPPCLAEDWDNVGLLVGDRSAEVQSVMTCLTVTPDSAAEAVARGAGMIVSHHPLPFRPTKRLTTDAVEGRLLWELARAGVAVYSPHTAFDSAATGINQRLAEGLSMANVRPLLPSDIGAAVGAGRVAESTSSMVAGDIVSRAKSFLNIGAVRIVGDRDAAVTKIAFACGSGGSMLDDAVAAGCDAFLTGEATFHTCLAAEAHGVTLLLVGHYASERFAVEQLAEALADGFPDLSIWASEREHDPIETL